jgi:hypothetical protein
VSPVWPPLPLFSRRIARYDGHRVSAATVRSRAAPAVALLVAFFAAMSQAREAHAHPLLDESRQRFDDADFAGALDSLTRAEATQLTAIELARLLADRAMVQFALGDRTALDEELTRLALVAPGYDFGAAAPPALREGLERARVRVATERILEVGITPRVGAVALQLQIAESARWIVRSTQLRGRAPGGSWREAVGTSLVVVVGPGEEAEFHASAVGPGGVLVAEVASSARALRPVTAERGSTTTRMPILPRERPRTSSGGVVHSERRAGTSPWIWVGAGAAAAALAVGAVVLAASSGGQDDRTRPSFPTVVE